MLLSESRLDDIRLVNPARFVISSYRQAVPLPVLHQSTPAAHLLPHRQSPRYRAGRESLLWAVSQRQVRFDWPDVSYAARASIGKLDGARRPLRTLRKKEEVDRGRARDRAQARVLVGYKCRQTRAGQEEMARLYLAEDHPGISDPLSRIILGRLT